MVHKWHSWLNMPAFDRRWHENDLADELAEYYEEKQMLKRWSELSDVVYTCTRARWSGHFLAFPLKRWQYYLGIPYMFGKYTGRFLFYRHAGKRAGANKPIRCVRNPHKLYKLDDILAEQHIIVDSDHLRSICKRQLRYWPLLP